MYDVTVLIKMVLIKMIDTMVFIFGTPGPNTFNEDKQRIQRVIDFGKGKRHV